MFRMTLLVGCDLVNTWATLLVEAEEKNHSPVEKSELETYKKYSRLCEAKSSENETSQPITNASEISK